MFGVNNGSRLGLTEDPFKAKQQLTCQDVWGKQCNALRCLGSDIELISEEKARDINPEAFIVLPWNFKKEIVEREKKYLNEGGKLMFVMPYPHVVTKSGEIKL